MHLPEFSALEARRLLAANLVADVGGIYPTDSVTIDGVSYFAATDATHGKELWRSDGTHAGTWMVEDITAGTSSTNPTYLAAVGSKALFFARQSSHLSLFVSDGTAAGTGRLAIVSSVNLDAAPIIFQNKLFFVTGLVTEEPLKLWCSDGTIAGTKVVAELGEGFSNHGQLHVLGDRLLINVAMRLWSTDGTSAGTIALSDLDDVTLPRGVMSVALLKGKGIIVGSRESEVQIWETDGTRAGTTLMRTFANSGLSGLNVKSGNLAMFSRWDVATDTQRITVTDGTAQGTREVLNTHTMLGATALDNGRFAFIAADRDWVQHLWVSDGTAAGTTELRTFDFFREGRGITFVDVAGTKFFMLRNEDGTVSRLWRTDGTIGGTVQVEDLAARGAGNANVTLTNVDNKLAVTFSSQTLMFDPATGGAPIGPATNAITLSDGVLRVFGTREDDVIRVYRHPTLENRVVVHVNGVSRAFIASKVRKIIIYSYAGDDKVELYERYGAIAIRSMIWSGDGNDAITGSAYPDSIYGEGGDDRIFGGSNADILSGGNGDDRVDGGSGNDILRGDAGADSVYGGAGQDVVSGGADVGRDRLDGGSGEDVIFGTAVLEIFYNGQGGQLDPLDELLLG